MDPVHKAPSPVLLSQEVPKYASTYILHKEECTFIKEWMGDMPSDVGIHKRKITMNKAYLW